MWPFGGPLLGPYDGAWVWLSIERQRNAVGQGKRLRGFDGRLTIPFIET